MDDEKLLLAEYQSFTEAFWKSEEIGEKRVEFFITLTTAVIAGIVALLTRSGTTLSDESVRQIATGALSAVLLLGIITYLRILQRNRVSDEFKGILDYLRAQLKSKSTDLTGYKLPFRSHKRLLKGGLAETIALMNSIIIGVMAALWFGKGWGWLVIPIIFSLTFALQVVMAKNDRQKAAGQKEAPRTQTFRAGVGAMITSKNGKVLGLERKDFPGSWQLPQGGMDEGESPLQAVKREVHEETGIEAGDLELLSSEPRLLAYELPEEARSRKTGRGQVQYWFLFRFTSQDEAITLGDKKEFRDWKWMSMEKLTEKVIAFKQPVYQELLKAFKPYFR
jgi:putative (di)nucleoside polyphosphate hydrolase